jgi:hypothetical protein
MGADLVVHHPCAAKHALGDGDPLEGALRMVELVKAASRARAVLARSPGKAPEDVTFTIVVQGPHGTQERQVSAAELLTQAAPLSEHAAGCDGCPANLRRTAYGCYGSVAYPITAEAEQWLVDRVEPPNRLGGALLANAIADFGYDGAPMAEWRERGVLGAPSAVRGDGVDGDQLFQALFAVGPALEPFHCALVLLWLGALAIDGQVPSELDGAALHALVGMTTVAERERRTRLVVGPLADRDVAELQGLLGYLRTAFVVGVPLLIDA